MTTEQLPGPQPAPRTPPAPACYGCNGWRDIRVGDSRLGTERYIPCPICQTHASTTQQQH